jgi:hypothetical protein
MKLKIFRPKPKPSVYEQLLTPKKRVALVRVMSIK